MVELSDSKFINHKENYLITKDMEFIKKARIVTDDFFYDLFCGGYIKPEELLKNQEDIDKVKNAIEIIKDFESSAENLIEYS